jgi:hypothetical protein
MTSTITTGRADAATAPGPARPRWAPLSGFGFVLFFVLSVVASSPPSDKASDAAWIADYTGHAHVTQHLVTGVALVLAGLSLMAFLSTLWTRVADARRPAITSPLPLVAAGVSASCIAVGGVLMGAIAATLSGSGHTPDASLLRFCNDVGFVMVGLPGMLAAAVSVACLSVQAKAAGVFGQKMMIAGLVVAVVLLAGIAFVPILALLVWLVVASVILIRHPAASPGQRHDPSR